MLWFDESDVEPCGQISFRIGNDMRLKAAAMVVRWDYLKDNRTEARQRRLEIPRL